MEQLILPDGVSRTNLTQKAIGGSVIALAAYFILPPFTAMLSAVASLFLLAAVAGLAVYTFQNPWILRVMYMAFDAFAWQLTRAFISLNPIIAMERYYGWLVGIGADITESRKALETQLLSTSKSIDERETAFQRNMQFADRLEKDGKPKQAEVYIMNGKEDEIFIKNMLPLKKETEERCELLQAAEEAFEVKAKQLEYSINSQKQQFKLIKITHQGMNKAKTALVNAGQMQKVFNEAQNQLNARINQMTIDINSIQKSLTPVIEGVKLEQSVALEEGRKLLEDFRAKRIEA